MRLRLVREGTAQETVPVTVRTPSEAARLFHMVMDREPVECFYLLLLDAQHCVTADPVLITRGTLTGSLVHPREVFCPAIRDMAAGVIIGHNHPSGDPAPSADDRAVTRQLVEAGRLLDIPVYDHVIVGRERHFSFAEAGWL